MRSGRRLPAVAVGSTIALTVLAAVGALVGPGPRLDPPLGLTVSLAAGFGPVGAFLVRHRPASPTARLTSLVGVLAVLGLAAAAWSGTSIGAWLTQWAWWPPFAVTPALLLAFPDGMAGPAARRVVRGLLAVAATSSAVLATAAALAPRSLLTDSAAPLPPAARALLVVFAALATTSLLGLGASLVALVRRARRHRGPVRGQVLRLTPAAALLPLGVVLDAADVPWALTPAVLALPLGIGAAILTDRLDDLDQDVPRGALGLVLGLALLGLYAAVLVGVQRVTGALGVPAALALAAVAALVDVGRRRARQGVERLLFGRRDAPYEVLTDLGRRLAAVSTPEESLRAAARAIVEALRVPRAAIAVEVDGRRSVVADHGHARTDPVVFPLVHDGGTIGALTVWTRRSGDDLGATERSLLEEVARQATGAAQAHRLTLALRAARERLVVAREDERLRLRRDFHDGVGPVIAGVRMQLHAARSSLAGRPLAVVDEVLDDLGGLGRSVRSIVDGLRPAELDLGLEYAVRRTAATVLAGCQVTVDATGDLADLPPAVEVAAFRILAEAMANTARHSGAAHAEIGLTATDVLRATLRDDGTWRPPSGTDGVGTASMRARAEEVGGAVHRTVDDRGTLVEAVLPVRGLGEVRSLDAAGAGTRSR